MDLPAMTMKTIGRALLLLLLAQAGLGACRRGTPGDAPASATARSEHSGLPGALKLRELDADQRRTLCDWTAQQYGGYGRTVPCGAAGRPAGRVPKDQIGCVTSFEKITCDVTVAQAEACTVAAAPDVCRSVQTPPPACHVDGC
jgi:hypothetical protein